MQKQLFLLALLVCLSWPGWAQELPHFSKPLPPVSKVLQMRYPGLAEWADANAPTMNEVQADSLADWYAKARKDANKPQLNKHPELKGAMTALETWNSDYYEALYIHMGGGTMYSHSAHRSLASLADVEFDALSRWSAPPKTNIAVSGAKAFRVKKKMSQYVDDKVAYKKALDKEQASLEKVKAAVSKLPPGPRAALAGYIVELASNSWGERE